MIVNEETRKLSIAERIILVEEIWDSIVSDSNGMELSEELKVELDRRLEDHNKNPHDLYTWEEIKNGLCA